MTNSELAGLLLEHIGNKNIHITGGSSISDILVDWAAIGELFSKILTTEELYADLVDVSTITADNAFIKYLECSDALFQKISSDVAEIDLVIADKVSTAELDAFKANINELVSEFIRTTDLVTETATVGQLFGGIAKFLTIVAGSVIADDVAAFKITSDHMTISDAFIKDAMIDSVTASKIVAGILDTSKVQLRSASGNLVIADNTIQISDGVSVRVQIGEDASGDYNLYVWDANGKLMWNALGITEDAIKSAIIKDSMVSEDANISGSKINIASVIREINGNTEKLNMSTIVVDADNQTLDLWFNTMETWKSETSDWRTSTDTQLELINGKFSSYVSQTEKAELEGQIEVLNQNYTAVTQDVNSINTKVSSLETQTSEFSEQIETANSNYTQLANKFSWIVASGTSQSDMVLTDTMYSLVTEQVNIQVQNIESNTEAKIQASAEGILQTVAESYYDKEVIDSKDNDYNARFVELQHTLDNFTIGFGDIEDADIAVEELIAKAQEKYDAYFLFTDDGLYVGKRDSEFKIRISNTAMDFMQGTNTVAYVKYNKMYIKDEEVTNKLTLGNYEFVPRENGNLSLRWRE